MRHHRIKISEAKHLLPFNPLPIVPICIQANTQSLLWFSTGFQVHQSTMSITIAPRSGNLGPLPTSFTPAPKCTQGFMICAANVTLPNCAFKTLIQYDPYIDVCGNFQPIHGCRPPAASPLPTQAISSYMKDVVSYTIFYSPGTACPSGWWPQTSWVGPSPTLPSGATPLHLLPGETALNCCPS